MRILIRFGDNDFYSTNMAFLNLLRDAAFKGRFLCSKEQIVDVYNEVAYGLFLLYRGPEKKPHLKDYLKISVDRVHLNNEIDEWATKTGQMNGDWFYADLDNDQIECW